jgi:hypothetical protein
MTGYTLEYRVYFSGSGSPERYSDGLDLTPPPPVTADDMGMTMEISFTGGSDWLLRRRLNSGDFTWKTGTGSVIVDDGTGWSSTMPQWWWGAASVNNDLVRAMGNHASSFAYGYADAVTAVLGSRPTFQTNVQNGKPGIYFIGTDLFDSFVFAGQSVGTEILAIKPAVADGGQFITDGSGRQTIFTHSGYFPAQWSRYQSGASYPIFGVVTTDPVILAATFTGDASAAGYKNGVVGDVGSAGSGSCTTRRIGQADGGGGGFNGHLFEYIRYSTVLSDAHRKGVIQYLSNKWNIAVTQ